MPPVQRQFTVIPDGPRTLGAGKTGDHRAAAPAAPPPMTTKQAQKLYRQNNRVPRLSKAEQRQHEKEAQEEIRKELEREKARTKARAARERKNLKEQQIRDERRLKGLPTVDCRSSQGTLSFFVRGNGSGRKRDSVGDMVPQRAKPMTILEEEDEEADSITRVDQKLVEDDVPHSGAPAYPEKVKAIIEGLQILSEDVGRFSGESTASHSTSTRARARLKESYERRFQETAVNNSTQTKKIATSQQIEELPSQKSHTEEGSAGHHPEIPVAIEKKPEKEPEGEEEMLKCTPPVDFLLDIPDDLFPSTLEQALELQERGSRSTNPPLVFYARNSPPPILNKAPPDSAKNTNYRRSSFIIGSQDIGFSSGDLEELWQAIEVEAPLNGDTTSIKNPTPCLLDTATDSVEYLHPKAISQSQDIHKTIALPCQSPTRLGQAKNSLTDRLGSPLPLSNTSPSNKPPGCSALARSNQPKTNIGAQVRVNKEKKADVIESQSNVEDSKEMNKENKEENWIAPRNAATTAENKDQGYMSFSQETDYGANDIELLEAFELLSKKIHIPKPGTHISFSQTSDFGGDDAELWAAFDSIGTALDL
jgi:hypothetical protein